MRIEIWSDVVCPWCYIGKRRLETALKTFPHADDVEIVWRSFELDPASPKVPVESIAEALGRKYGGGTAAGEQMVERVSQVAVEDGLDYSRYPNAQRVNTVDAHRLLHLALHDGGPELQGALKEALLHAYFVEARNVADHAELTAIATGAGLDPARVAEVLGSNEYRDEVSADIEQARAYGAIGVPFYVIDQKYGVSGAQPAEAFRQVLDQAWSESHPTLQMAGDAAADACGPDGCAI